MEIKIGYLYHIKDEFFDLVNDEHLMRNHENGHSRPNYFVIKDMDFYWAIPLSSRIEKYKLIVNKRSNKMCKTIMFGKLHGKDNAILLQNAFPVIMEYIKNIHLYNSEKIIFNKTTEKEILKNFKKMLILKKNGINLFYPDVDKIKLVLSNKKDYVNN